MGDFSMMRHYHEYIDAVNSRNHVKRRVEDLKSSGLYLVDDEDSYAQWKADIAAAEAELKTADAEVERLYYLSHFGKSKEEVAPDREPCRAPIGGHVKIAFKNPPPPKSLIP